MTSKLYENYTSTSALVGGDVDDILRWNMGYVRANYQRFLPARRDAKILEVGCGFGKNIWALRELGYSNVTGIDFSAEQISVARDALKLPNVELTEAAAWLADRQSMFDCILAIDVLEHIPRDELIGFGRMLERSLAPDGTLIVQVPNDMAPLNPIRAGDLTHVGAFTTQSLRQFFLASRLAPVGYFEVPPYVHGLSSIIRRMLWFAAVRPLLTTLFSVMHGRSDCSLVFSSNILGVAIKKCEK